jgi:hypothetical protein
MLSLNKINLVVLALLPVDGHTNIRKSLIFMKLCRKVIPLKVTSVPLLLLLSSVTPTGWSWNHLRWEQHDYHCWKCVHNSTLFCKCTSFIEVIFGKITWIEFKLRGQDEDGGSMILQSGGVLPHHYMVSKHRRQWLESSSLWKPQVSQVEVSIYLALVLMIWWLMNYFG